MLLCVIAACFDPVCLAGLLFFQLMFMSFRTLFVALFTFPNEFKMLLKERASGMYRLSAFYFARTASVSALSFRHSSLKCSQHRHRLHNRCLESVLYWCFRM